MEEITIKDSLKITPMQVGGAADKVQLVLNGYLDTYNSPEFQSHVNSLINSGINTIIFNCNGLNYISSTGIGAFTDCEVMFTTRPQPRSIMPGRTCRQSLTALSRVSL